MIVPQPRRPHGLVARFTAPLLALLFCSCGSNAVRVHPVRGQLFVAGQPAVGAVVVFHPLNPSGPAAPHPSACVGPDGSFMLTTYARKDGAPAGAYAVAVAWFGDVSQANPVTGDLPVKLSPSYGNAAVTPLRAEVKNGPNVIPAFNLPK
jgi:hypothetical protein